VQEFYIDTGNMLGFDYRPVNSTAIKRDVEREEYLTSLARENTQLVVNAMWEVGGAVSVSISLHLPPSLYRFSAPTRTFICTCANFPNR
jgi:hypothetical protein